MAERPGAPLVPRRTFLASAAVLGAAVATGTACASDSGGRPDAAAPGTAASGTSITSITSVADRPDPGTARRVAVLGAGLAGLTAAVDLRDAGWDVVVLEARDRVGGRVHTLREPFSDGLHAEAGGESIDDSHAALLALITRFGLTTERRAEAKTVTAQVFTGGRRQSAAAYAAGRGGKVLADYERFDTELTTLADGLDPEHPEAFASAASLDARTLADFVDGLGLEPEARFLVETENRGEYNAELADVSLLFAAQQAAVTANDDDNGAETMRIHGGNSLLPEAMLADLGERVVLRAPVSRVEWHAEGVRVITPDRRVDAARLVVAMPTPPLRRIEFSPGLPAPLARAIAELQLGAAAKVTTQYRRRFWTDLRSDGLTLTDLPFHVAWAATDSYGTATDPGLLSQFITGTAAIEAAALTDAERIRVFQDQLDQVYPEGVDDRTDHHATVAWANEPYTGGGYAVYSPGQLLPTWSVIRAGVGPILFAGEHTETLAGYMESAVRSGHRVARQIGDAPR